MKLATDVMTSSREGFRVDIPNSSPTLSSGLQKAKAALTAAVLAGDCRASRSWREKVRPALDQNRPRSIRQKEVVLARAEPARKSLSERGDYRVDDDS